MDVRIRAPRETLAARSFRDAVPPKPWKALVRMDVVDAAAPAAHRRRPRVPTVCVDRNAALEEIAVVERTTAAAAANERVVKIGTT